MVINRHVMASLLLFAIGLSSGCDDSSSTSLEAAPEAAPVDPDYRCVVLGDGISRGVGLDTARLSWPEQLDRQPGFTVYNATRGGAQTDYAALWIDNVLAMYEPTHVLMMLGSNDAVDGVPLAVIEHNIETVLAATQQVGATLVIGTVPPFYNANYTAKQYRDEVNRLIRNFAGVNAIPLADIDRAFGDDYGLLLSDGIHPTADGHTLIMIVFRELFER